MILLNFRCNLEQVKFSQMKLFKEKNKLEDEIFHLVNLLDGLYLSLKIRVVLSDLEIWEQDPYGMGQNPEDVNSCINFRYL